MLGVMADVTHDSDSGAVPNTPDRCARAHRRGDPAALVGMLVLRRERTILDEDGFETISREMIENDEIRTQVATTAVDRLFANVDVEAAIAERLTPAQQGLARARRSRALGADRAAEAALEEPRVQTLWVETTTATQQQLVSLLDDETEFIQAEAEPWSSTCVRSCSRSASRWS